MNSFIGIFRQHFKLPLCFPHLLTYAPLPSDFEEPPPPCSQHLWETLLSLLNTLPTKQISQWDHSACHTLPLQNKFSSQEAKIILFFFFHFFNFLKLKKKRRKSKRKTNKKTNKQIKKQRRRQKRLTNIIPP